jgi:hypothetical protein
MWITYPNDHPHVRLYAQQPDARPLARYAIRRVLAALATALLLLAIFVVPSIPRMQALNECVAQEIGVEKHAASELNWPYGYGYPYQVYPRGALVTPYGGDSCGP